MAKKSTLKINTLFNDKQLSAWNFVIFLAISLIILVFTVSMLSSSETDLRTKAKPSCAVVPPPNPDNCQVNWRVEFDDSGCPQYICDQY